MLYQWSMSNSHFSFEENLAAAFFNDNWQLIIDH